MNQTGSNPLLGRPVRRWRVAVHAIMAAILMLAISSPAAHAQEPEAPTDPPATITRVPDPDTDATIKERLDRIYAQISAATTIEVAVAEGVVTLSGRTTDRDSVEQALEIARRLDGVVAVQDRTETSLEVRENVSPFLERIGALLNRAISAAPLILLSTVVFVVVAALGLLLASWSQLWRRLTPNPFVADLLAQAVRLAAIILGIVVALNLAGATALMAAILGGAGVIGLAVGLAVRDSLENYVSSIMLSLRQPFRANDHVIIDSHEGKVVRLTSRATILMTLDGNHLRIPNATVYKAIILNYTRNPERRLQFELGIDADDDPKAAINTGTECMLELGFLLRDPAPNGTIVAVGDSNIILNFTAWINQQDADFLKARSEAIRATKIALEAAGFTLPEPIYRLRIDQMPAGAQIVGDENKPQPKRPTRIAPPASPVSVAPEGNLDEKIAAERRETSEDDLLDSGRPTE